VDGGLTLKIDAAEFDKTFGRIISNLEKPENGYRAVGAIARESIRYNFEVGGRPTPWKPSKAASARATPGKRAATLRKSNRLMNSFTAGGAGAVFKVTKSGVLVGTNVIYAATMNSGAKKGGFGTKTMSVRAHTRKWGDKEIAVRSHQRTMKLPWGDIPAREFALLQTEDITEINKVLATNIVEGT